MYVNRLIRNYDCRFGRCWFKILSYVSKRHNKGAELPISEITCA